MIIKTIFIVCWIAKEDTMEDYVRFSGFYVLFECDFGESIHAIYKNINIIDTYLFG